MQRTSLHTHIGKIPNFATITIQPIQYQLNQTQPNQQKYHNKVVKSIPIPPRPIFYLLIISIQPIPHFKSMARENLPLFVEQFLWFVEQWQHSWFAPMDQHTQNPKFRHFDTVPRRFAPFPISPFPHHNDFPIFPFHVSLNPDTHSDGVWFFLEILKNDHKIWNNFLAFQQLFKSLVD